MPDFHIRTDCRLCAGPIEKVLDLGETALANELKSTAEESLAQDRFPLFLSQCKSCGHVQLPVVVKPERLFPPDYPYQSGTNPVFRAHLKEFARTVGAMVRRGTTVLEIASNDGTLLREFASGWHSAHGIDPAAKARTYAIGGRMVIETAGFFNHSMAKTLAMQDRPYSVIVALNVFAHVDDLNDFTAGVAALLPEDGLFVFEVGYLPDVIEKGLFDVIYAEHLSYHHLRPLVPFFERHGLEMFDAHRVDSQGGSVRCYVARRGATLGPSARMQGLLATEEGLSLEPLEAKIFDVKHRLHVLGGIRMGATFAGFGAPAKLTTLLAACSTQINGDAASPSAIYDDNPNKVGRFTPGTGIPIRSSSELMADQPDYCIIFSWNFANEIMARFPGYKGKWVIPLPEFRVVPGAGSEAA